MTTRDNTMNRAERATTETIGLMIILYVAGQSWDYAYLVLKIFFSDYATAPENAYFSPLAQCLIMISRFCNPFLYVLRYDTFRKCLLELFCGKKSLAKKTTLTKSSLHVAQSSVNQEASVQGLPKP